MRTRWKSAPACRAPSLPAAADRNLHTATETGKPRRGNKKLAIPGAARIPGSALRLALGTATRRDADPNVPRRNLRSAAISILRIAGDRAGRPWPPQMLRSGAADFFAA